MKKTIILFVIIVGGLFSIQATTISDTPKNDEVIMSCSGQFNINGDSYTITLHDVSWWTCAKFKVASWFK